MAAVKHMSAVLLVLIFCAGMKYISVSHIQSPSNGNNTQTQTGQVCSDFLGILVDHVINRAISTLQDPLLLGNYSSGIFQLTDGQLYGLNGVRRTCELHLDHEEMWRKPNNTTPDMGITIPEWMRKRDEKTGDILYMHFCLGITGGLRFRGIMTVSMFLTTFGPDSVLITISEFSVRMTLSVHLNRTGKVKLNLAELHVNRLGRITIERDFGHRSSALNPARESEEFNWSDWANWLINEPLYRPLLIMLEASLADSISGMLSKQDGW